MVRKQLVIPVDQDRALEERARALGVSQSELVRRGIALVLEGGAGAEGRVRAWSEAKAVMQGASGSFGGAVDSSGRRTWTREDLHDR